MNIQDVDCIAVFCLVLFDQLLTVLFRTEVNFDEGDLAFTTRLLVDITLRLLYILLLLWKMGQGNICALESYSTDINAINELMTSSNIVVQRVFTVEKSD